MTELSIVLPCLNEARALPFCVEEARAFFEESGVEGELLLADNGSSDGSQKLALQLGLRVVLVEKRGYGAALQGGIQAARGRYVIMADCDGSYDLRHLEPFLEALRAGGELVVGDRYALGFRPGASPWLHEKLGVPCLSALGRMVQRRWDPPKSALIHDFHCGLRGVEREAFLSLDCRSEGMEFASEMILAATACGQHIVQIPTELRLDLRGGEKPHLRAVRDGLRHLRVLWNWLWR